MQLASNMLQLASAWATLSAACIIECFHDGQCFVGTDEQPGPLHLWGFHELSANRLIIVPRGSETICDGAVVKLD